MHLQSKDDRETADLAARIVSDLEGQNRWRFYTSARSRRPSAWRLNHSELSPPLEAWPLDQHSLRRNQFPYVRFLILFTK